MGSIRPRLWTRPLRKLTPETSYGYAVIAFAAYVLGMPLDPWQQWAVIHAGELLPDGRPRFRTVLLLVPRQNGKTHLCAVLALYWMFVERIRLTLGTSTKLDYAAESWKAAVEYALAVPALSSRIPTRGGVKSGKGAETLTSAERCRYKIGTADRKGGRSLPVERLICDELREHTDWSAYNAAMYAMNAQPHGQAFLITNQGDDTSVVLNELRDQALHYIDTGQGDYRLGIIEYSAPEGADIMDPATWAIANPQLGRRIDHDTMWAAAIKATKPGADPELLTGFLTESLCMRVPALTPAIDPAAWKACERHGSLDAHRGKLVAFFDMAPDMRHATLAVAARIDGALVRVETVKAWEGPDTSAQVERELPAWVARVRPQLFGWMPAGPAAATAAVLADRRKKGVRGWPPAGVTVEEIRAEASAVCMGLAGLVDAGGMVHSGQALLDHQVGQAERLERPGGTWVFGRNGDGHVDAVYAVAGAAHLARTLPTAIGKPRIILPKTA